MTEAVNLDAAREACPCVECEHCRSVLGERYCVGPHVRPDIVTGKAFMILPAARLETDPKFFRAGWRACGEAGNHWKQREDKHVRASVGRARTSLPWGAIACIIVLAAIGFVYFNGVPLCR